MAKVARSGAEGNNRLLKMYGGAPTGVAKPYAKGYASGGKVDAPMPMKGGGKPSAKSGGKKGGTNVNVIVVPKGADGPPPMPGPGPMMDAPPMLPPGGGPPGPGMPPMRKHGGKVVAKGASSQSKMSKARKGC